MRVSDEDVESQTAFRSELVHRITRPPGDKE